MSLFGLCKRVLHGLSKNNIESILQPCPMPAPRKFDVRPNPEQMGDFIPGLVSFIIPTMHRSKTASLERLTQPLYTLREVLKDIHTNVRIPFEVIVVCNETANKSFMRFVHESPHIARYCQNSENVGVPRSWNMGAEMAMGEYLCFVNDDVEIGPNVTEAMVETMIKDPKAGMVGPAGTKWHRQEPGEPVGKTEIEVADAVSGWLFMTSRSAFTQAGGFDIAYSPALVEEIDYSFAIQNAGYKCLVIPHLLAVHHHVQGASSAPKPLTALGFSCDRDDLTKRNRAYFEHKWNKFWNAQD